MLKKSVISVVMVLVLLLSTVVGAVPVQTADAEQEFVFADPVGLAAHATKRSMAVYMWLSMPDRACFPSPLHIGHEQRGRRLFVRVWYDPDAPCAPYEPLFVLYVIPLRDVHKVCLIGPNRKLCTPVRDEPPAIPVPSRWK